MEQALGQISSLTDTGAIVSVDVGSACARCNAGKGCGAGLLQGTDRRVQVHIDLPPGSKLREGDRIALAIAPVYLLRGAMLAYGLPLVGLLAAVGIARLVAGDLPDWQAVLSAIAGLAGGLVLSRVILSNESVCRRFVPRYDDASHD
jgi:sigma-E factor negative regulatory protein RseC